MGHTNSQMARALNAAPTNDEARITETTVPGPKDQQAQSDFASGNDAVKRKTNIVAALALRGYCLRSLSDGTWIISKWNLSRPIVDLHAAAPFLHQVGGAE